MRTKSKARKYIDPDDFHLARRKAGLTREMVADMLDIDVRTVRNWENGQCAIPYAAFRLIRMAAGYSLLGEKWEGWGFYDGKLFSPAGRSFAPHELLYVSNYISMARLFIKGRENLKPDVAAENPPNLRFDRFNSATTSKPLKAHIVRGSASDATASFGAKRCHEAIVIHVNFSQQEKGRIKPQALLMFGKYSSYSRAAANQAFYG
jgi:transcriptional regulator with XRE-family HTH domain